MAKTIDKKGITNWVLKCTQEGKYTPARVAEAAKMSRHTLGAIFDHSQVPTEKQLEGLCGLFGEDIKEIKERYGYLPNPRKGSKVSAPAEGKVDLGTEQKNEQAVPEDTACALPGTKEAFGRWFSHLMESSGLSVNEYAELAGISATTVRRYRSGASLPAINTLQAICGLHNINWLVPACYFGFPGHQEPEAWLGRDYRKNPEWAELESFNREEVEKAPAPAKKDPVPAVDIEKLKAQTEGLESRNRELEAALKKEKKAVCDAKADASRKGKALEDCRAEMAGLMEKYKALSAEAEAVKGENAVLEEAIEWKDAELKEALGKEREDISQAKAVISRQECDLENCRITIASLEAKCGERFAEVEAARNRNAELLKKLDEMKGTVLAAGGGLYAVGIEKELRTLLPNAESVAVTCTDGNAVLWTVSLPGMKEPFTGAYGNAKEAAVSIQEEIRTEAMKRLGF